MDVDVVRLSVTARDATGAFVHDLTPGEFQVFEDGVAQEIAHFGHHESPISVVVLFDKSQSMMGDKLMHAKDAVVNFTRAFKAQDEVLVIAFSDSVDVLEDFGLEAKTIERATKRIEVQSSTRLYDAVLEASRAIGGPDRKEKRAILILSDGEDTASEADLGEAVEAVKHAGVPVYSIGIEVGVELGDKARTLWSNPPWRRLREPVSAIEALKRLTDGTGGWTFPIAAAKRCKEVCIRVADELRHQYFLGYYPSNRNKDRGWRTIRVQATRSGVSLETRSGYYAAAPP